MSSDLLVIRPFAEADRPRVLAFLQTHYPASPAKADARHFDWQFAEHPLGSSLDEYYLAWQGETLVGQLATMRDRLLVEGTWHEVRWLCDLMVAPEERGGLAALRLFQAAMQRSELLLAVGAGPTLEPLYRNLGWRRFHLAETYYLPIRPRALLRLARATGRENEEGVDLKWLVAAVAGGVLHRVLPGVVRKQKQHATGVTCAPIAEFTDEIEAFLVQTIPQLGTTPWRSAESLRWKFHDRPASDSRAGDGSTNEFHAWIVRDRSTGLLRGMLCAQFVERAELARWLEIVDYVTLPEDRSAFMALVCAAMETGLSQRADFLRFRLSRPEQVKLLAAPWWRQHTLPVTDEVFAYSSDETLLDKLGTQPWHLTSIVSDRA